MTSWRQGRVRGLEVQARPLSADALAAELERVECASVLVCHPDQRMWAIKVCSVAGVHLKVRAGGDRCMPGEWELF